MKKRIGLDGIILIGLLVLLAVVSLQIAGRDTGGDEGTAPRRSTVSARPGGWKAAFLLLQRSGFKTGRWEKPPKTWPDSASIVIAGQEVQAMAGEAYWKDDQAQDALEWVDRGGTLVVLTAQENALTEALGISPQPGKNNDVDIHPTQPLPYLVGVKDVVVPGNERFLSLGNDATVLLGDDKPAVVAVKRGKGRVIAVSTAAVIENNHLADADNARFLVQTVAAFADPKRPGGVLWDEYHQGYQEEYSFWTALGQPGQFAFFQLVILIALVCYSAGVRFGLPRPLPPQDRLSSEYVSSLADLYRRARASDAALDGVYLSFWRDLCRAVGMALDSDADEVARRAAASLGNDLFGPHVSQIRAKREQKLLNLLRQCEIKIDGGAKNLPEHELLQLARALEDMRKELQLGRDERRD